MGRKRGWRTRAVSDISQDRLRAEVVAIASWEERSGASVIDWARERSNERGVAICGGRQKGAVEGAACGRARFWMDGSTFGPRRGRARGTAR